MHEDGDPTQESWKRLTKAARYPKGVEKVTWAMRAWEHDETGVDVHVGSDWAKGLEWKSTSGGMMMTGQEDKRRVC